MQLRTGHFFTKQDNAVTFLFGFDDSDISFLDLIPTDGFPVICVRGP